MNRRDFLKFSGLISAFACIAASPIRHIAKLPVETAALGKIYRGTYDGSIHISEDNGKSWQLHSKFGPDCPILDIFTGLDGRLYVHAGFKQYSFHLVLSQNEKSWLSQPLQTAMLRTA
jgi:hypothetical protein